MRVGSGRRRAAALLATLLALLLAVTGCVDLPRSTDPRPLSDLATATSPGDEPQLETLGPQGGEQPDEIVRGFLTASASNVRTRPAARLFLTPEAGREWADDAGVRVIAQDTAAVPDALNDEVTLSGRILGEIDASGVYTSAREELSQVLSLVQVDGEWRITNPPPGVLLRVDDFRRAYVGYNLYFLDPTGSAVVPDPRYFLSGSAAPANSLVEALIDGPSPAVADAVRTEFGDGVELARNVQPLRDVDIDLTGLGERDEAALQRLSAQLVWTLRQVPITSLTLRSDGQILEVDPFGRQQPATAWADYDPDVVAVDDVGMFVSDGALLTATGEPVPGPAGTGEYALVSAGVASGLTTVAGVSDQRTTRSLLIGAYGEALTPVLSGASFTAPSWVARQQEVWTVRNGTEVVRVRPPAAPESVVITGIVPPGPMRSLRITRDGTRVAVVAGPSGDTQLYIGKVIRSGSTVTLASLAPVYTNLGAAGDCAWASADQLFFLAFDPGEGRTRPWLITSDGAIVTAPPSDLPGIPTAVAAAPGRPALVSSGGVMYQLDGSVWTTLVRGSPLFEGTAPTYPS